jgi:hypothetical protein
LRYKSQPEVEDLLAEVIPAISTFYLFTMKAKSIIFIILVAIGLIVFILFNPWKGNSNQQNIQPTQSMSESDKAVAKIKAKYSEFSDYPSDLLPPKSIKYAQVNDIWYVAFIQEGSGVPIISAKCFTVDGSDVVTLFSEFTPQNNDVLTNPFSPIYCKLL